MIGKKLEKAGNAMWLEKYKKKAQNRFDSALTAGNGT